MSIDPSTSGTLDFKQASKVTFVGSSSNTVIDTVTGSFGIGVDVNGPSSNLHVVGNTRLEGDINMLHTSNNAAIKLNSNVVTEFPRSKKLIKYPRVALTGSTSGGYTASASVDDSVNDRVAWKAFNSVYPRSLSTDFWYSGASGNYNGGTTGREYDGSTNLGSDSGRTATDSGEWLQINLPNKIQLTEFKVWGQPNTINNHPAGGVLYARNTINEDWTELHVFDETRISVSNTNYTHELSITPSYYNTYALVIKKVSQSNPGTTGVSVGELELFGIPEYDPDAAGVDVKVTSYPNVPNTDWLEVYYDAKNYTSGNNVQDETANNRDGVLYGNTSFSSADGIHKFDFDGNGDYIKTTLTGFTGTTVTFSAWVFIDSIDTSRPNTIMGLGSWGSTGSAAWIAVGSSGTLETGNKGITSCGGSVQATTLTKRWLHITGIVSSGDFRFFQDGQLLKSLTTTGTINYGTDPVLYLATRANSSGDPEATRYLDCKIANARLFNRALTSDEVWQLYAYQKEYFGHGDLGMTLKAGRLGIGTSEPRAMLDVRGTIRFSLIISHRSITADTTVSDLNYIPFSGIIYETSSGLHNDNYFTCPIKGVYQCIANILTDNANDYDGNHTWLVNGSETSPTSRGYALAGGGNNHKQATSHFYFELNAGDTVGVASAGTQIWYGSADHRHSAMSIRLITPT